MILANTQHKDNRTDRSLAAKLQSVENASMEDLQFSWTELFGREPAACMREGLMRSAIAYRLQAQVYGDVRLGQALVRESADSDDPPAGDASAGVRLIRTWQGELHEVQGVGDRFFYRGQSYKSLSAIARQITGTRWNGLTFFGVRDRADLSRAVRSV